MSLHSCGYPMLDPFVFDMWRFVRGDTGPREFEQWLYARTDELENRLGNQKALDLLAADYGSAVAVASVRKILRAFAAQASLSLPCRCVTLANVTVVEMGSPGDEVGTIEVRRSRGEPWWWLWCGECSGCGQWWLVGQEERQNDVFCLRRLHADEVRGWFQLSPVWSTIPHIVRSGWPCPRYTHAAPAFAHREHCPFATP
jgi:hypothetical protein